MIRLTLELLADEFGPHETYVESAFIDRSVAARRSVGSLAGPVECRPAVQWPGTRVPSERSITLTPAGRVMSFESHPLLTNAPIQEAVIDFRVSEEGEDRLSRLEMVAEALGGDLPEVQTQRLFEGRVHLEDEGMAVRQDPRTVVGLMLRSGDGRRVAQVRRGGFSLSHLHPYESWEKLYSETMQFWATYRRIVKPETVTRVATRFINRLRMPERYETGDYFTSSLEMAPGIQGLMASFNYFYVLAADSRTFAGVRLANEAVSPGQGHSTVLFDIDCYIPETRSPEDAKIAEDLGRLRILKNNVFFRTLTPRFLEELA